MKQKRKKKKAFRSRLSQRYGIKNCGAKSELRYIAAEARLASIRQIRRVLDYDDLLVRSLVLKMRVLARASSHVWKFTGLSHLKSQTVGPWCWASVGAEITGLRMEGVLAAGGDG